MGLFHVEKSDRGLDGMDGKEEIKAKTANTPSSEQGNLQPGLGFTEGLGLIAWG